MTHLALIVWLLGLADGGASDPAACRQAAADLDVWLKKVVAASAEAPSFPGTLGVRLVGFQGGAVEATPLVEVLPGKIALDGRPAGGEPGNAPFNDQVAALGKDLARLAETYQLLHPGEKPSRVTAAIDRDVTWSQVVALADAFAAAGYSRIDWAFASTRKTSVTPPGRSSIDEQLAAIRSSPDASRKAAKLADLMARVTDRCPDVRNVMGGLGGLDPAAKPAALAEKAPPAVAACRCALDVNAFKALLYAVLAPAGNDAFSVVMFPLARGPSAGARSIKAAASAPWSAAYKQVVDAARAPGATTFRLVAR